MKKTMKRNRPYFPNPIKRDIFDFHARPIEGYQEILDANNGNTFKVLSDRYSITRHEEMLEIVEEAITASPEYGKPVKEIQTFDGGAKMRSSYIFSEVEITIGDSDKLNPRIDIFNSYDGGWSRKIFFGAFRLICSNGLVVGEKSLEYRTKHVVELDKEDVIKQIRFGMERLSEQKQIWNRWVDEVVLPVQYEIVMEQLPIGKRGMEELHQTVEVSSQLTLDDIKTRSLSLWMFYNILCQYATHKSTSHLRRVQIETAIQSAFRHA